LALDNRYGKVFRFDWFQPIAWAFASMLSLTVFRTFSTQKFVKNRDDSFEPVASAFCRRPGCEQLRVTTAAGHAASSFCSSCHSVSSAGRRKVNQPCRQCGNDTVTYHTFKLIVGNIIKRRFNEYTMSELVWPACCQSVAKGYVCSEACYLSSMLDSCFAKQTGDIHCARLWQVSAWRLPHAYDALRSKFPGGGWIKSGNGCGHLATSYEVRAELYHAVVLCLMLQWPVGWAALKQRGVPRHDIEQLECKLYQNRHCVQIQENGVQCADCRCGDGDNMHDWREPPSD
jgi:hypothetical protein